MFKRVLMTYLIEDSLALTFERWAQVTKRRRHNREVLNRYSRRLSNRALASALLSWRDWVSEV